MDSINKNQPEENRKNLESTEAIEKIKELVEKAGSCFFCTEAKAEDSSGSRPMAVQRVDDEGDIWFLSAADSHKNLELEEDSSVTLYFQGSGHSDFLMLRGSASVSRDRKMIDELWEPIMKTWFTEGKEDARITVIRFSPQEGYYWDTKHGKMIAGIKMLIGAATGRTLDDSIEGTLRV